MQYWLMKSEPDVFSFDDLKKRPNKTEPWNGVRNYQARNFMRDSMQVGDQVLFYHSNANPPGVAGIAEVASKAYPDLTQWDTKSEYYDPKATRDNPRWYLVDVRWKADFKRYLSLDELRANPDLLGLLVTKPGQRLSVQPVEKHHFEIICRCGGILELP